MKITLPYLPIGICRDQTVHDVEYYTMEHMHEYAEQAIREFVEGQRIEGWIVINKLSGERRVQKHSAVANVDITLVRRYPLIIKPELDDCQL